MPTGRYGCDHEHDPLQRILQNNRHWSQEVLGADPDFFNRLKDGQSPEFLWIGCSDSRVPANQISGLAPGEIFVQRNVGNQAMHTDLNLMSCLEYAVKELKVKAIVVCGHYSCGAVKAALKLPPKTPALVNCWISGIRDVRNMHENELKGLEFETQFARLCELNVIRQCFQVCTSSVVQGAWDAGQKVTVYGVIYNLKDGLLTQLAGPITGMRDFDVLLNDKSTLYNLKLRDSVGRHLAWSAEKAAAATPAPIKAPAPKTPEEVAPAASKVQVMAATPKSISGKTTGAVAAAKQNLLSKLSAKQGLKVPMANGVKEVSDVQRLEAYLEDIILALESERGSNTKLIRENAELREAVQREKTRMLDLLEAELMGEDVAPAGPVEVPALVAETKTTSRRSSKGKDVGVLRKGLGLVVGSALAGYALMNQKGMQGSNDALDEVVPAKEDLPVPVMDKSLPVEKISSEAMEMATKAREQKREINQEMVNSNVAQPASMALGFLMRG